MIIDKLLQVLIPYITSSLELIGVLIITIESIRAVFSFLANRCNFQDDRVGVRFAQAMSLSLEFKLAAEIIKTVIIRDLDEFAILAAVAILRVVIAIVLHWELKTGAKDICETSEDFENNKI